MFRGLLLVILLTAQIPSLVQGQPGPPVIVNASQGQIQGFHFDGSSLGTNYYGSGDIFLGIPFVQPPVGNLRFRKPAVLTQFTQPTPYNATYFRPACPQYTQNLEQSEDCLYLNVMTPSVNTTTPFPVMVWIHGGALTVGTARDYGYEGAVRNLVSRGVVVVTIQYRLGLLGYFTTFTDDFPPNLGALDQIEALKWVQKNIAAFGGDPTKVTIFGQSGGGCSVSSLTLSPLGVGLFNNVIAESGTILTCFEGAFGFDDQSRARANTLCNVTDTEWCAGNTTRLAQCMAGLNYSAWVGMDVGTILGWRMAQDDYFMPYIPAEAARRSPGNRSLLFGNNRDEWGFYEMFFKEDGLNDTVYSRDFLLETFGLYTTFMGPRKNDVAGVMIDAYTPNNVFTDRDNSTIWQQITSDVFTSAAFTGPIVREVAEHILAGHSNVYLYEFTYPTQLGRWVNLTGWTPVYHSSELTYIWFGTEHWLNNSAVTPTDLQLADYFGTTWTNFAKTGNLGCEWPTAGNNVDNLVYMEIGATQNVRDGYRNKDNLLWRRIIPTFIGFYPPSKPDRGDGPCSPTSMSFTGIPVPGQTTVTFAASSQGPSTNATVTSVGTTTTTPRQSTTPSTVPPCLFASSTTITTIATTTTTTATTTTTTATTTTTPGQTTAASTASQSPSTNATTAPVSTSTHKSGSRLPVSLFAIITSLFLVLSARSSF